MRFTKSPLIFGRFLLICDKAFRSAACWIASFQPEDSVAVTRRAVECAKTGLAIKLDANNFEEWIAVDQRLERWARRQSNEKPKGSVRIDWEGLKGEPLVAELDKFLGILSDAYVHFTPEFFAVLGVVEVGRVGAINPMVPENVRETISMKAGLEVLIVI